MKKLFFPVLLSLSALMMLSCSDEATNSTQPPECENDECEQLPNDCQSCTLDEKKCDGDTLFTCQKKDDCTEWVEVETCNTGCNAKTLSCNSCEDECTPDEKKCDDDALMSCQQSGGCAHWVEQEACEFGCNEDTLSCISCIDECQTDEKMCDGNAVLICKKEDAECTHWVVEETCPTGKLCSKNTCVDCEEICTKGDKKCDLDGVLECNPDANGCAEWNRIETCKSADHCDESTHTCVAGCVDKCIENAKQCASDVTKGIQTCIKNDDGCLVWSEPVACDANKICTGEDPKCEYACGPEDSEGCKPWSIVILPDTQSYLSGSKHGKDTIYYKQTDWIVKHKDTELIPNLKMVVHMGDITDDNTDGQWEDALLAQNVLKNAGIPFTVVTGNHDYREPGKLGGRSKSKFKNYFPESYLKTLPGYGGIYSDVNTYFNFNAGGQNYLVLNLEFAPRQQTLVWANDLLQKAENLNKKVIVVTHGNVKTKNDSPKTIEYVEGPGIKYVPNGASGQELWDNFTSLHSNIIMVLSGHAGGSYYRKDQGHLGNTVYQILTDYQFELRPVNESDKGRCGYIRKGEFGGNGWLRILTFNPTTNNIEVKTRTVLSGNEEYFVEGKDQFYCSSAGDINPSPIELGGNWYSSDPTSDDHNYTLDLDFTTPKNNIYYYNYNKNDKDYLNFITRNINNNSNGNQLNSSVAAAPDGHFVVVWEDDSSDKDALQSDGKTNAHDIYGRILNPGGVNISGKAEIIINDNTDGHQSDPDVAMDENGNFVVVWTDDSDNNGSTQVHMRGFKADGSEHFKTTTVNLKNDGNQYQARVAMAPDGQFAISWTDERFGKDTPQIMVRGFDSDGNQIFAEQPITDTVGGLQIKSDIYMDSEHNVVVVWEDDSDGNGSKQANMRIINNNGEKSMLKAANKNSAGNQYGPSVSGKPDGSEFIVSWTDAPSKSDIYTIKAAIFDKEGNRINENDLNISTAKAKNVNSQVCMNNTGNAMIVWSEPTQNTECNKYGSDSSCYNIMYRKHDNKNIKRINLFKNGVKETKYDGCDALDKQSENYILGTSYQPAIACIPGTDYAIVTYSDDADGNEYFEIYGVGMEIK